ncbi:MAG: hypothetical protein E8D52_17765 [Nitrospira sp.]|nr:MAG: hypothetical protein E8D52_17765 [Nitrospira sp.]
MFVTSQQLIEGPRDLGPHVVLLGAGASRAAFPSGDAAGRRIPLMTDLVEIVGLQSLVEKAGRTYEKETNFEAIYGRLALERSPSKLIREIERCIDAYFAALSLPSQATLYDRLLVSLRPTDAVFTFNWDPFLFDAYQRNRVAVPLPEIFFLHGNVRIGMCLTNDRWGARGEHCPDCLKTLTEVPLLYPIERKDYSSSLYIRRSWDAAKALFAEAFTLTIFGYGAPASGKDAVELLRSAWLTRSNRKLEHIEIIDTEQRSCLDDRWSAFAPTLHYTVETTFERSRLSRWPRRSCESLVYPMTEGLPCDDFPLPDTDSLNELQEFSAHIARYESHERKN